MSNARDIIFGAIILFVFGIAFFAVHYAFNTAVDEIVAVPIINASTPTVTAFETVSTMSNRMDYVVFGLFIGIVLGVIITGWLVGGSPIFMFLYFLVLIVGVMVASILTYVWDTFINSGNFGLTITYFPITNHILSYLPLYIAVLGFIGVIVMFSKPVIAENMG